MNIFHLDKSPEVSALYHCDKHVVKMILETGQTKDCEFFCDLAGTEQDHIIKLHDVLTYQYNTGKVTLEEVRFAIRKLELKI
mgnify:CR=1 FL=1